MAELGRILIADDEETFLLSTADLLRREGYKCDCAPEAKVAAEMLSKQEYDLLVADIRMPGNTELEFIQALPEMADGMPVILVTGYPSLKTAIPSIQLPVAAYLVKPIDFEPFLLDVKQAITNFRFHRSLHKEREHLRQWVRELENIPLMPVTASRSLSSMPVETFLDLNYKNIISSISDLLQLSKIAGRENVSQNICHLVHCPRLTYLKGVLAETIDVLEKTKSAFKSKDLGDLRKKLAGVVKSLE